MGIEWCFLTSGGFMDLAPVIARIEHGLIWFRSPGESNSNKPPQRSP